MNAIIEVYNYLKCLVLSYLYEEKEQYESGDYSDGNTVADEDRIDGK